MAQSFRLKFAGSAGHGVPQTARLSACLGRGGCLNRLRIRQREGRPCLVRGSVNRSSQVVTARPPGLTWDSLLRLDYIHEMGKGRCD